MHPAVHELFFLPLGEELDAHATYGFFDHIELLVLRIRSVVSLFFHVLPFVLLIDSGHLKVLASS